MKRGIVLLVVLIAIVGILA
jgi:hypothetical protein